MKIILQRVTQAKVTVNTENASETTGQITRGYVALLGITHTDTPEKVDQAIKKIKNLRLFPDSEGKTNLSITDIGGEILVVSQFTLYADCRKGNRPSFTEAAPPALAEELYEYFLSAAAPHFAKVAHGKFAASMQVELTNDGPFTVTLDL